MLYDDGERLTIAEQRGYGLEFNDEREFVDNYKVIRVQQKSKKQIKKSGLGWRKHGIPQNVFPRFYLPPSANVS